MDNERIKKILLDIHDTNLDFTVTQSGKSSRRVNGLYKTDTHEIILHNKNFKTDNELIYTAAHEYAHHLMTEETIALLGDNVPLNSRVHSQAFWAKFNELIEIAEKKKYYSLDVSSSPELEKLTEEIQKNYLEKNGKLMQEFGRLLSRAHDLCEKANIRYEDYLDRALRLPRVSARDIAKLGATQVNPALGYDSMKLVASIKNDDERASVEKQLLGGANPIAVRAQLRKERQGSDDDDPKKRLEKEKRRLERTIEQLRARLEYVEDALGNL